MTHAMRLRRAMMVLMIALFSLPIRYPDADHLLSLITWRGCAVIAPHPDHAGILEDLRHAYEWNDLLTGSKLAAINQDYFSPEDVLQKVEGWSPLITCIAREFAIPPELLAGIMSLELDLDYHATDAIFDSGIRSPWGRLISDIEIGVGYAQVHYKHLRPALATFGRNFSSSPFYQAYYVMTTTRSDGDLTLLATLHPEIDLANAAVMARYYALLRLDKRPMNDLTTADMAFIWSAYRGGVVGTEADPRTDSRWSLDYLRKTDNPHVFGDTLIALPYFAYYRNWYHRGGTL
ncbi:MAG: hypothetical protein IT324_20045 [Anaerolineae bacterium]|nr:hypothetical protein [Anaerolineae bacterium]